MPLIASAMVLGAFSGALIAPSFITVLIALAAFAAFLIAAFVFARRLPRSAIAVLVAAALSLGFGLAGGAIARSADISVPLGRKAPIGCEGVVIDSPQVRPWGARADVRLSACSMGGRSPMEAARGTVRLSIGGKYADLLPGERIRFRAKFFAPREYQNPGGFSYRRYLAVHGIGAQGYVYGRVERSGGGDSFLARIELMRRRIADSVGANVAPPARGIVVALAIGDQGVIDPDLRGVFANTGLAHILAISGMNVGYVAAFIFLISHLMFGRFPWLLLRIPQRQLAAIATIPVIWAYVLLTGLVISCIRAALMLMVFLIGVVACRRQDLITTLAVSVIVILLFLPLSVLDVSFQLSVIAVAGIVLIAPRIVNWIGMHDRSTFPRRCLAWGAALVAVSVAAGVATAPIVAYHFKFVAGISLLANLIAVPLSGALLSPVVAVASGLALISPSAAVPLWKASGWAATLLVDFAGATARIGEPLLFRWAPGAFDVAVVYAAIVAIVFWRRMKYRKAAAVLLSSLLVFNAGYGRLLPMIDKRLTITFFDVGQGDSALVQFPGGRTMLVDAGGIKGSSFDIGRHVVAPALWRMGIHKLDFAILTHPHHDHYKGLSYIAEKFRPEVIWTNGLDAPPDEIRDWEEFLAKLKEAAVPLMTVGDDWPAKEMGGVNLRLIKPPVDDDLNAGSLVVDLRYGSHRFLIAGDLAGEGVRWLVDNESDLSATLIKLGHHGCADAAPTDFLNAAKPRIAVISVGSSNKYGMPDRDTIERLEAIGSQILRTDLDGAVTITSDGKELNVETFVKR